jgi:hypothetical protein
MSFKDFVSSKLNEEAKKISSNLLKNLIDILRDYVSSEFDLSEDQKIQIINNMKISLEEHDRGVIKKGPKFVATSTYNETEDKETQVEIVVEIVTEKMGKKQDVEAAEEPMMSPEDISPEE